MTVHAEGIDRLLEQPRLGNSRMNPVAVGTGKVRLGVRAAPEGEHLLILRVAGQAPLVVLFVARRLEGNDLGLVTAVCRVFLPRTMTGFA